MQVVKAETLLTVMGTDKEIVEISLHLGISITGKKLFITMDKLCDKQKLWLEEKMELNGLHDMMSILFEIKKE